MQLRERKKIQSSPPSRKKQAVTKTRHASTITLIKQNSATSPLLSLPSEIRERIIRYLLGDRLIHIVHPPNQFEDYSRCDYFKKPICHTVCQCDPPTGTDEQVAGSDGGRRLHQDCRASNAEVLNNAAALDDSTSSYSRFSVAPVKTVSLKDSLVLLQVCRQLYEEGHQILWSSNTFSFSCPVAFAEFLSRLNGIQKNKVENLHFFATLGWVKDDLGKSCYWTDLGDNGGPFTHRNLAPLRSVKKLDLCIDQGWCWNQTGHGMGPALDPGTDTWKQFLDTVIPLRVLPFEDVSVMFNTSPSFEEDPPPEHNPFYPTTLSNSLSPQKQLELSQELVDAIIDLDGLEKQQDADAKRIAKKRERAEQRKEWQENDTLERSRHYANMHQIDIETRQGRLKECRQEVRDAEKDLGVARKNGRGTFDIEELELKVSVACINVEKQEKLLETAKKRFQHWDKMHKKQKKAREKRLGRQPKSAS